MTRPPIDAKIVADVAARLQTPEHRAERDAFAARLIGGRQPYASSRDLWPIVVIAALTTIVVLAVVDAAGG